MNPTGLEVGLNFIGDQMPPYANVGDCYVDPVTNTFHVWNGSTWLLLVYDDAGVSTGPGEYLIQEEP